MAQIRPWFMASPAQFRIGPPPPLESAAYTASFDEVKARGSRESKVRTEAETIGARFWADYGLDIAMRQMADMPGRRVVANARMYALVYMAGDDIDLVMMDGKMHHFAWRPLNAIRQAGEDGNPATVPDQDWESLLPTPRQPEHPCGHCSFAGVVGTIMMAEGPAPAQGLRFDSGRAEGTIVTLPDWKRYMDTVSEARILAGVHFRYSWEASMPAAEGLARLAMARIPPLE